MNKNRKLKDVDAPEFCIINVFTEEELKEFKKQNNGTYRGPCPDCGSSAANPFVIWPNSNNAYCHKTGCKFNLLETIALKYELIRCSEGRYDKSDPPILAKELYKEVLEVIKTEYGMIKYNKIMAEINKWKYENLQIPADVFEKEKQLILAYMKPKKEGGNIAMGIEKMVRLFEKYYHVYTLRDDVKTEIWIYVGGIYIPQGATYIKEFVRLVLGGCYQKWIVTDVIDRIVADTYIESNKFFEHENIYEMPVQNGVVQLKQKKLTDFTPKKIFFTKLPLNYDENAKPKETLKFISEIVKPEDVSIIQELFGYSLLKDYPISKAFMFLGSGANGKSRLILLLKSFVGAENCSGESLDHIQKNDFATSNLFKKLLNLAGDMNANTLNDTKSFKEITGGDRISADRKFKTPVYFHNYAKLCNSCNDLPKTNDLTDGFFRRWILITFPNKFVPKNEYKKLGKKERENVYVADEQIIEKITSKEEMSGLLNWALEGLDRLLEKGCFSYSSTTKEIRNQWLRTSNSFAAFALDNIKQKYDSYVLKSDLKTAYTKYCRKHKVKIEGDKTIHKTLADSYGAWSERSSMAERPHVWRNIKLSKKKEQEKKPIMSKETRMSNVSGTLLKLKKKNNILNTFEKTMDTLDTLDKKKQKKNDREIQFYDAEECKNIVPKCTEKDVFLLVKKYQKSGLFLQKLHENLGVGCVKHKNNLLKKGKIYLKNGRFFPK